MTCEEWKAKLDTNQTIESAKWLSVALDDQFVRAVISNLLDYVKELSEDVIRLNLAQFDSVWGDLDE